MHVLISDTSVLVDLERGSLLEARFRLPFRFVSPKSAAVWPVTLIRLR